MDYLGTMFFILTPFGFFCTENGTGFIVGPLFLILGFLCKWVANGGCQDLTTPKVRVTPEEFWIAHFKSHYNNWKDVKYIGNAAENARKWANDVARAHDITPPSNERYEEIAKELGYETLKAYRKRVDDYKRQYNRLQSGKSYLMLKLYERYRASEPYYFLAKKIEKAREEICFYNSSIPAIGYSVFSRFKELFNEDNKDLDSEEVLWLDLTKEEKEEAQKWVDEYEEKFLAEAEKVLTEEWLSMEKRKKKEEKEKQELMEFLTM